ncbi:hypothetical protein Taro_050121 [Colocasia esculenta]|uniref:VQ domain-containing protein n=1 Tax=Colocasia esculenta TaxID=4460 RepID=A0A843XCL1_COLES|nr:hypothetical protein [Colocasia esculenta]
MAIRDSSSGQSDQWAQYYQRNTPGGSSGGPVFARDPPMTESTVVTTTATSAASSAAGGAGGGDRAQPVSEGRVGKARRRSRASRKAPTTVLNTDTTNFRAMVQQFTGVPTVPFQGRYPQMADVGAGGGAPAGEQHPPGSADDVEAGALHRQQHHKQL